MLNVPNILTLARIAGSFFFLFYALQGRWGIAFPLFCLAALTDMVDGTIARLLHQRTPFGAFLDPAADKLLMLFSFVSLTRAGLVPLGLTAVVIGRDLLITVGLLVLRLRSAAIAYRPTFLSKMTTLFQIATVFSSLLKTQRPSAFLNLPGLRFVMEQGPFLVGITAVLTVVTGIQYLCIGIGMLRHATVQADCQ